MQEGFAEAAALLTLIGQRLIQFGVEQIELLAEDSAEKRSAESYRLLFVAHDFLHNLMLFDVMMKSDIGTSHLCGMPCWLNDA